MSLAAVNLLAPDLLQAAIVQVLYSSILAAVVMIGLRLLRVRAPLIREAAWSLVLLRLMVPPGWHSGFSIRGLLDSWLAADPAAGGVRSFAQAIVVSGQQQPAALPPAFGWQTLVALGWIGVVAAITVLLFLRMNHYNRICRRAFAVDDPTLLEMLADWKARLGVRRTIRLVSSGASLSPFTSGSLRPSIFLPESAMAWDRQTLDSIIGHEMVHIARWDEVRILVTNLIRTIHFFNPVAWLAAIELGQAREERCDEVVVRTGAVAARDYRRSLVDILRLNQPGQPTFDAIVGLIDRKEGIKMRVVSIQSEALPRKIRPLPVLLGTILAAVLLVPMAPAERPPTPRQSPGGDSDSTDMQPKGRVSVGFGRFEPKGSNVRLPSRSEGADPEYTEPALAEGTIGTAKLQLTIGTDGVPRDIEVVQGLPNGLTEAALEAVRAWRFRPALRFDEPIEMTMQTFIVFSIFDGTPENLEPVLVTEVESLMPYGITLTGLTTDGDLLNINGVAENTELVGEFLVTLNNSPGFSREDLRSMGRVDGGFEFHITCVRGE